MMDKGVMLISEQNFQGSETAAGKFLIMFNQLLPAINGVTPGKHIDVSGAQQMRVHEDKCEMAQY